MLVTTLGLHRGAGRLFALGALCAYIGLSALVLEVIRGDELVFLWFTASAAAMVAGLLLASRRFGVRE
jgi:hypothetical protein